MLAVIRLRAVPACAITQVETKRERKELARCAASQPNRTIKALQIRMITLAEDIECASDGVHILFALAQRARSTGDIRPSVRSCVFLGSFFHVPIRRSYVLLVLVCCCFVSNEAIWISCFFLLVSYLQ